MQGSKLRAALLKCESLAWHSCLFCWAVPAFTGPFLSGRAHVRHPTTTFDVATQSAVGDRRSAACGGAVRCYDPEATQGGGRAVDMTNCNLNDADLQSSNLQNSTLKEATCRNADFYNANLTGACLVGADLTAVVFHGANLQRAGTSTRMHTQRI